MSEETRTLIRWEVVTPGGGSMVFERVDDHYEWRTTVGKNTAVGQHSDPMIAESLARDALGPLQELASIDCVLVGTRFNAASNGGCNLCRTQSPWCLHEVADIEGM